MHQLVDLQQEKGKTHYKVKNYKQALTCFLKAAENNPYLVDSYTSSLRCMQKLGQSRFLKAILQQMDKRSKKAPHFFNLYLFQKDLKFKNMNQQSNQQSRTKRISALYKDIANTLHCYDYLDESFKYYDYININFGKQDKKFYHYFQGLLISIGKKYSYYKRKNEQLHKKIEADSQFDDNCEMISINLISKYYFEAISNDEISQRLKQLQEQAEPQIKSSRIQIELEDTSKISNLLEELPQEFKQQNVLICLKVKRLDIIKRNATKINYNVQILRQIISNNQLLAQISQIQINTVNQCFKIQKLHQQSNEKLQKAISFFKGMVFYEQNLHINLNYLGLGYLAIKNIQQSIWIFLEAITEAPYFINPYLNLGMAIRCLGNPSQADKILQTISQKLTLIYKTHSKDSDILFCLSLLYRIQGNQQLYNQKRLQYKQQQLRRYNQQTSFSRQKAKALDIKLWKTECFHLKNMAQKFQTFLQVEDLKLMLIDISFVNKQFQQLTTLIQEYFSGNISQNISKDQIIKRIAKKYEKVKLKMHVGNQTNIMLRDEIWKFLKKLCEKKQISMQQLWGILEPRAVTLFNSSTFFSKSNQDSSKYSNHSYVEFSCLDSQQSPIFYKTIKKTQSKFKRFFFPSAFNSEIYEIYETLNSLFMELQGKLYEYICFKTEDSKISEYIVRQRIKQDSAKCSKAQLKLQIRAQYGQVFSLQADYTVQQIEQNTSTINKIVKCLEQNGIYHGDFSSQNLFRVNKQLKVTDFDLALVYKTIDQKSQIVFNVLIEILGTVLDINLTSQKGQQILYPLRFIFFGKYCHDQNLHLQYQDLQASFLAIKLGYDKKRDTKEQSIKKFLEILSQIVPKIHKISISQIIAKLKHKRQIEYV